MPINDVDAPYQLNEINGSFIMFKLIPSITEFVDILIELIERSAICTKSTSWK